MNEQDKIIRDKINRIETHPLNKELWNKDRTWEKLLKGKGIQHLTWIRYAAALIILVLLATWNIKYINRISGKLADNVSTLHFLENKADSLTQLLKNSSVQKTVVTRIDTIYLDKEPEIVYLTNYIKDTVTIVDTVFIYQRDLDSDKQKIIPDIAENDHQISPKSEPISCDSIPQLSIINEPDKKVEFTFLRSNTYKQKSEDNNELMLKMRLYSGLSKKDN